MQLLDIDLISQGPYTWPHDCVTEQDKRQAQLTGITQAVQVRAVTARSYEIIGDPKPWFLAQAMQLQQVPVVYLDDLDEQEIAELAKPANTHSNILDQAARIASLLPRYKSKAALGRAHNMTRAQVCNLVRIHKIPDKVKQLMATHPDKIAMGHAKVIAGLPAPEQLQLVNAIIQHRLSVHATEEKGRELKQGIQSATQTQEKPADVIRLEQEVSELIGCETTIDLEQGRVVIDYQRDVDVLEGVLEKLGCTTS